MARAKILLTIDERYELVQLFSTYPQLRLTHYIEEDIVPEKLYPYLPYIESQIHVALIRSIDEYNKGAERSRRTRPRNFKRFADKVCDNYIEKVIMKMNASISRVEGNASRKPLREDKELYKTLTAIRNGEDLLVKRLDEIENN